MNDRSRTTLTHTYTHIHTHIRSIQMLTHFNSTLCVCAYVCLIRERGEGADSDYTYASTRHKREVEGGRGAKVRSVCERGGKGRGRQRSLHRQRELHIHKFLLYSFSHSPFLSKPYLSTLHLLCYVCLSLSLLVLSLHSLSISLSIVSQNTPLTYQHSWNVQRAYK